MIVKRIRIEWNLEMEDFNSVSTKKLEMLTNSLFLLDSVLVKKRMDPLFYISYKLC